MSPTKLEVRRAEIDRLLDGALLARDAANADAVAREDVTLSVGVRRAPCRLRAA